VQIKYYRDLKIQICQGFRKLALQPVYRNIGQFFFKVFVHEIFIFVFGIIGCAGPAAKIDPCSGSFDIEFSAAAQASFFYIFQDFILYLLMSCG